jgi:cyanophycinase
MAHHELRGRVLPALACARALRVLQSRGDPTMKLSVHRPMLVPLLLVASVGWSGAQSVSTHGPARGSLVLQGGVGLNRAIAAAFVARAGGPESHIVVIPTASVGDAGPPGMATFLASRMKESFGVAAVSVLHTINRADAEADSFVEPLRKATGVWMLGGFPENLVHAYLGTKTERAIKELLERGGVVGGESAGAMIQGSWLDTTDSEWTPEIHALIQKHGTSAGFGLLKRGPAAAVKESATYPDQLAIGIDNETALIVRGALAEVVGAGTVSMYDGSGRSAPRVVILRSGDRYDLSTRRNP